MLKMETYYHLNRKYVNSYDKPLLGAIIKPKIGIKPNVLLDMVKQLVDGGVDFIKEDEIMSNPLICPLEERVELISNYLAKQTKKVVLCHTVNCDPHILSSRKKILVFLEKRSQDEHKKIC